MDKGLNKELHNPISMSKENTLSRTIFIKYFKVEQLCFLNFKINRCEKHFLKQNNFLGDVIYIFSGDDGKTLFPMKKE